MIGATHIDPVWLWPWQEGYQEARATFRSALDRMDEYPDFVFTCDQVVLLSWVEESDPEMFERIRERVREGRWVNAGGWWVEPDCNMPMGESFVRHGLYGQRFLESRFGRRATVGMNVDPFGHNVMLPQILRGHGLDTYMFLRPGPHESDFRDTLFWWEAPDGSRVLAYRIPFEYCSPPGPVDHQTEKSLQAMGSDLDSAMVLFGVGNHGGGPTKANIDSIHRFDRMGSFGRMRIASPREYFDDLLARGDDFLGTLPVRSDDLQHHASGCYSAHSGIKAWQKRAQFAVLSAERWAAVAERLGGRPYPRAGLENAWKQVLFNQFHDTLPGSAIETAYDDARDQLGEATAIAKRIIVRAHNEIARRVNIPFDDATQPVLVFNPHPWPVTQTVPFQFGAQRGGVHVVDADGSPVPAQETQSVATTNDQSRGAIAFRAEVPAFGYRLYRLAPGRVPTSAPDVVRSDTVLENEHLRVEVDPGTGWVSSLLDKATGMDLVAGTGAEPHTVICEDPTDTWGHRVVSYAWPGSPMETVSMRVRERGALRGVLRVERRWGSSTMIEEFVLEAGATTLRVDVELDWREQAHVMKVRVPVALDAPRARYEIPMGSMERPVDGAEEPVQGWVDLSGEHEGKPAGLTVVLTNKNGVDVSPATTPDGVPSIGITATRSPVYSWHDPRTLDPEGIYRYQDQGVQQFGYALAPHAGRWQDVGATRRAAELGRPVRAMAESFHQGDLPPEMSFADDGAGRVMVTAVKGAEDEPAGGLSDVVVRAVEIAGEDGEATIEVPFAGVSITRRFTPHQIRTFRISASGDVTDVDLLEGPVPSDEEPGEETTVEHAEAEIHATGEDEA
ncbi:alpha-mannosidase [Isoptericola sp. NPDC056618]|uniref:alpha-mannosidase n=1 Tax=Isoptericola sp. NPDC056618 TaxID=3345878 RepID=UPI0036BFCE22